MRRASPAERLVALHALDREAGASAQRLAGVDEAGRGPLAGPVVAAAVVLPNAARPPAALLGVDDSKTLSHEARVRLDAAIRAHALDVAVGVASNHEIDQINILNATHLAMRRAIEGLAVAPHLVLIDGNPCPDFGPPQRNLIKGDARSLSIGAASIVAKVHRDHLMQEAHRAYPAYRFDLHKGYGTAYHRRALEVWGITPLHRLCFQVVSTHAAPRTPPPLFEALWDELARLVDNAAWETAMDALLKRAEALPDAARQMLMLGLHQRGKELGVTQERLRALTPLAQLA